MQDMKKAQGHEAGFSMIELMFALAILAIGLLAVIQLQVSAYSSLAEARHRTVAIEIAERKMELLKTLRYTVDQPTAAPLDADSNPIIDASGNSGGKDVVFYDSITMVPSGGGMQGQGDYIATLHWDEPVFEQVDKDGNLVTRGSAGGIGGMTYFILWTIERGGSLGTPWPPGGKPSAPTYFGKVCPVYVPGPNQMRIRVIVGWFEPRDRAQMGMDPDAFYNYYMTSVLPTLEGGVDLDYKEPYTPDPIGGIFEYFPRRVVLESVRDQIY